jgi:Flp pilus assembly secretin CpaC
MAEITRVNGNVKGQGSGGTSGAISADELVILNGADLDFFKIIQQDVSGDVNDIRNELDAGESVEEMFKSIQTKANIEMYQVEGDNTGQISVAVYPAGAWTTTTLQAALRALGTTVGGNSVDVSGTTVTSSGLEFV